MRSKLLANFVSGVITTAIALAVAAHAQEFKTLKVGGGSFTTAIAQANGIFTKYGLQIQIPRSAAGGSEEVRRWLASGELDLADYGVDNAIAMVENTGVDVILVAATDYTPTELMAQPEIRSLGELRGKTVLVDAPNTQNALALKKILASASLTAATDYMMKEAGGTGGAGCRDAQAKRICRDDGLRADRGAGAPGRIGESGDDGKHLRTDAALRCLYPPPVGART